MITQIPGAAEFYDGGLSLLDLAWDTAIRQLSDIHEADQRYHVDVPDIEAEYWQAAKQRLATAVALTQQGVEFLIKGRIAEVSPFLLIGAAPREWPKGSAKHDTAFSDFRTIDAQDLVKVHDSCAAIRLADTFVAKFEELRRRRNAIMHTVDSRLALQAEEVVSDILFLHHQLFPNDMWLDVRRAMLEKSPTATLHSTDFVEGEVAWEFSVVRSVLTASQLKEYFGFDTRRRAYICSSCSHELIDDVYKTAFLEPNSSRSRVVRCAVCGESESVDRRSCTAQGCKGNVISSQDERCLTCGSYLPSSP